MEVFRVEDRDGTGPYAGVTDWLGFQGYMEEEHGVSHELKNRHPAEGCEHGKVRFGTNARWAFTSYDQLREWFDYFGQYGYDVLRNQGYAIVVYEVPSHSVIQCTRQCVYDRNEAVLDRVIELPTEVS